MSSARESIAEAYDNLDAAFAAVAALSYDALTVSEKKNLLVRLETHRRRTPAVGHSLINQLAAECAPEVLGGTSLADVLATALRISMDEARRRIAEADDLGPRATLTGEPLEPHLPTTAIAEADGKIGAEHIDTIRTFFRKLPKAVDHQTREQVEIELATLAVGLGPTELRKAAGRLAQLLDQDGPAPTDADRARKRYFKVSEPGPDGMSEARGLLDPEARAYWEAAQAKLGAPGMCNPDDDTPAVDEQPSDTAKHGDSRSQGQRNHDAFKAMARSAIASGKLGQHNGLPVSVIVSTTLSELESAAGQAVTGGGTLLPMSDLIRMASQAHHYLVVFEEHTRIPLYLGRIKRCASPGQRIVLHARDRGCTFPGCTVPGYRCQAHHGKRPWARDGNTNVDEEVLACPPHNRLVEKGGWTTRIRHDGRVEWIPPPHLDTGQRRVNDYHHPENYLLRDADMKPAPEHGPSP